MIKETPIMMQPDMIVATLRSIKNETRRTMKPQPEQMVMGGDSFDAMKSLGVSDEPLGWTWKGTRFIP